MKKLLAVVLALMMVLTLAVPLMAQADELEEITILYPGEETDAFSEFINGAFAEKVNFRFLSWDAYWDQKRSCWLPMKPSTCTGTACRICPAW